MTLREHIENNLTLFVLGTLLAGFVAGVTVYRAILEIVKPDVVRNLEAEVTNLKAELKESAGYLRTLESDNLKLRHAVDRHSPDSLFSVDDPYPKGFRAVRIGDRIDVVSQVYSADADIEDNEGWLSVNFRTPQLFRSMTYYYDENARVKTVTHILFHFKVYKATEVFKEQLIETFGRTNIREIGKGRSTELVWSGIQNLELTLGNTTLHIKRLK